MFYNNIVGNEKNKKTGDRRFISILKYWKEIDYKKVRKKINWIIRGLENNYQKGFNEEKKNYKEGRKDLVVITEHSTTIVYLIENVVWSGVGRDAERGKDRELYNTPNLKE